MAKSQEELSTLKRLKNHYRLVVMNDDTYEEVVTFKLNRLSVYIALCTIFVVLVGLTVSLIVFTPLKYYIPGYGSQAERREMIQLKIRADSLETQVKYKEAYWNNVKNVLSGQVPVNLDTTQINVPEAEKSVD
ncbi:hypothetical protein [Pollutibacter soli]|uniref:hypothetical protein n=1 Tax=Pollutibacter soli TaxID=3034157 RepID=UPI0030140699